MTDDKKPAAPKKGPVFVKPKEPEATPSKSAPPKSLAVTDKPWVPGPADRSDIRPQRNADPPKKDPAFAKPREPEATPSKSAQQALGVTERPRAPGHAGRADQIPSSPAGRAEGTPGALGTRAAAPSTPKPRPAFVEASLAALDTLDCDSLAICVCSDVRPLAGIAGFVDWRLCGRLSELMRRGVITGASKEKLLMPYLGRTGPTRVFVLGWGPQKSILDGATERLAWMVDLLTRAKVDSVAIGLPEPAVVLLGLIDEHVRKPLGEKCAVIFAPDQLLLESKTIIPAPVPMA